MLHYMHLWESPFKTSRSTVRYVYWVHFTGWRQSGTSEAVLLLVF